MNFDLAEINSAVAKFKKENGIDKNQTLYLILGRKQMENAKYLTYCGAPEDFDSIISLEKMFNVEIVASEEESLVELSILKVNNEFHQPTRQNPSGRYARLPY